MKRTPIKYVGSKDKLDYLYQVAVIRLIHKDDKNLLDRRQAFTFTKDEVRTIYRLCIHILSKGKLKTSGQDIKKLNILLRQIRKELKYEQTTGKSKERPKEKVYGAA